VIEWFGGHLASSQGKHTTNPEPQRKGKIWRKQEVPTMEENQVSKRFRKLDKHKSKDPDGMHP